MFTPVHLRTKTLAELVYQLRQKFPESLPEHCAVGDLFQQTRGSLVFHLDDEMVDGFKSRQVFEVKMEADDEKKTVNITLIELEMT